jgi:hypothetical protein
MIAIQETVKSTASDFGEQHIMKIANLQPNLQETIKLHTAALSEKHTNRK